MGNPKLSNFEAIVGFSGDNLNKDALHRLSRYVRWLDQNQFEWTRPNLEHYAAYLMEDEELAPTSVQAHISTIRGRYRFLLSDPFAKDGMTFDEEMAILRALTAESPSIAPERTLETRRLTQDQVNDLFRQVNASTVRGLRDLLVIGFPFETGISEGELSALQVHDLYPADAVGPAIRIRGDRDRSVAMLNDWLDDALQVWLRLFDIDEGAVLRSFTRNMQAVRAGLTPRTLARIYKEYPIREGADHQFTVSGLDLRRAYAQRLAASGLSIDEIQKSLGHATVRTTLEYLSFPTDLEQTFVPPDLYSRLKNLPYKHNLW